MIGYQKIRWFNRTLSSLLFTSLLVLKTAVFGILKLQFSGTPKLFTVYCKLPR